ncbi:MAG: nuclear transport factor 2 family protein, partial [Gemmatimonadota bacterium]
LRNPTVLVHPPIAVVWAPYDFHVEGVFSHCGIDLFEMLEIDGEWKMTNASWTVETEGCEPSALGP